VDGPPDADEETDESPEQISRAERRRRERDVIEDHAPQEGVDVIRSAEAAVLVGAQLPGESDHEHAATLKELEALLDTAGGTTVAVVSQKRDAPDPATFIGSGKVDEVKQHVKRTGADAVVFNEDLSPAQQRNLEERLKVKVLDRTIIILDIFAQHATSREGKAQVEMAQLAYLLPRLRGWGDALSRQAGGRAAGGAGIGGRGPGETQLEVDRRRIQRRLTKLRRELEDYERIRRTKASRRESKPVPTAALVGYTNAGKSSLLNMITESSVLVRDQLFATLDPTARQLELPDGREVVLTDTVGFIRKLPTGLVEAFLSTLEESARADLIVHVVDASHAEAEAHIVAVREVLEEIGADQLPVLLVLNKADAADPDSLEGLAQRVRSELDTEPVVTSAVTGRGRTEVIEQLTLRLPSNRVMITAEIPFAEHQLVALAHEYGEVEKEAHGPEGTTLVASVDKHAARRLRPYLTEDPFEDDEEPEPWELEDVEAS
jgi:GTP-binding protein HflX